MNEVFWERKRRDYLNNHDWNIKARYKKAHGLHNHDYLPFNLWLDYILKCADYYAEIYKVEYNGGYIEVREKGGTPYELAREAYGRLWYL